MKRLFFILIALIAVFAVKAEDPIKSFRGDFYFKYEGWVYLLNLTDETLMLYGPDKSVATARAKSKIPRKNVWMPGQYEDMVGELILAGICNPDGTLVDPNNWTMSPALSGLNGMFARARPRTSSQVNNVSEAPAPASSVNAVAIDKNKVYHLKLVLIGNEAFKDNTEITEIELPNTVTTIWAKAFQGCTNLKKVTLHDGLVSISWQAFCDCTSLQSITLPKTVTDIGFSVFRGCTGLTTADVQADSLPSGTFMDCKALKTVHFNGNIKQIGQYTFWGCDNLGNITLPSSVEKIVDYAFYESGVTGVDFAEGSALQDIGGNAFEGCKRLTSISLPEGLTDIGEMAFRGSGLTSVSLPNSVEKLAYESFQGCLALEKVNIGDGTKRIEDLAFASCTSLKEVNFGETSQLEYIGKWAFSACSSLKEFLMPKGVKEMGEAPFESCNKLETFRFSAALASIPNEFFANNKSLKTVTWTSNPTIKSIPSWVFSDCTNLETIEIPPSVTSIDEGAFAFCSSLKSITLPANLTSIDYYAFECSGLTEVTLPDNLKTLGGHVFHYCKDLKTLNMGNGLTEWDASNINGCDAIESIQWSDGLTKIDKEAFSKKSKLRSFTFGPNPKLEEIGERAFAESGLTSFVMPNSVKTIGESAFWWCWLLEDITLSEQLTAIPSFALAYTKIKELSIPASVTATGYNAFSGQESAFPYHNTLTDVYIYATTPPVKCEDSYASDSRYISGSARDATLHVPYGSKAAYAAADGWKSFKAIVEMEGDDTHGGLNGDVDGDGEVTTKDVVALARVIAAGSNDAAADVNGDGVVNIADLVWLTNQLQAKK